MNIFGDNAARTKARLEAWSRKKKMETEMMMMALLIHNCVLNYVLGPFAGSH